MRVEVIQRVEDFFQYRQKPFSGDAIRNRRSHMQLGALHVGHHAIDCAEGSKGKVYGDDVRVFEAGDYFSIFQNVG